MRACGGRENRRERALRIIHLVEERATVALFPLFLPCRRCGRGALSLYKSSRRSLGFFPPAPAHKSPLPPALPLAVVLSTPSCKHPTPPKAMAGDDVWPPSNVTRSALDARVKAGILRHITDAGRPEWIVPSANDREPNPPPGYVVCFLSFLDRGFGTPGSRLIRAILHYYEVELHNLNPNSVMQAAVFATVCEGFLPIGTFGSTSSRRIWPPATRGGRNFPCGSTVARCSSASSEPASISGAPCPHRTGGGRAGGFTSGTTAGCSRSIPGRW